MKNWFTKNFLTGYTSAERIFMLCMIALQIIVFAMQPDSILNVIAGIAGVISVVLCAKGKITFYFIGFVQTCTYIVLTWQNKFYGEVIENLWYFVTMLWGIFAWKKNMNHNEDGTDDVIARKFTKLQWVISAIGTVVATIAAGFFLKSIGSAQPFTDAATNILAIFAQILMVKRYREQWIWWLLIDILCVKMWYVAGNWSMVAMYFGWTINCIYGWLNWSDLKKKQEMNVTTRIAEGGC